MRKIAIVLAALLVPSLAHAQAQLKSGHVWGNSGASEAPAADSSVTAILDRALGSTRGAIPERGASGWAIVGPGATAGLPWTSNGAGADPAYQVLGIVGGGTGLNTYAVGDIIYASGSTVLARLADIATGNAMLSGGVGVAPAWGKITSAHLNITPTTCTNQFVRAVTAAAGGTCASIAVNDLFGGTGASSATYLRGDGTWAGAVGSSGSSTVGDLATFSNTSASAVVSPGYNAQQVPGLIPTTATVTISNASPGVVTWTAHGLTANATIYFCTSGTLPTGLTACVPATGAAASNTYASDPTLYYVVGSSITANTFTVATSIANAKAGIAVNTSSAGSGTHTAFANALACAGCVGEAKWNVTPTTNANVTSGVDTIFGTITLTAGIWKVGGSAGVFGAAGTVFQTNHASLGLGISTISTTPLNGTTDAHVASNNANGWLWTFDEYIVPVFGSTALNAVCEPAFTVSTATCFGNVHAVRIK